MVRHVKTVLNILKVMVSVFVLIVTILISIHTVFAKDANGNYVVVIDPGHGGTDPANEFGATYNNFCEKDINLTVAKAMQQELSQYDGICTYLTHDQANQSMSLGQRAEFAQSVDADFFISIHFNASANHNLFGTEIWIPSLDHFYVEGYQFADIALQQLTQLGMYNRGIKTRVGDNDDEYYGIIRENEHLGISAVIIEHCYLDYQDDLQFCNSEEKLASLGKQDAIATAKYLGLSSKTLNLDFSNYKRADVPLPQSRVYQDQTPPEQCEISLIKENLKKKQVSFSIAASDKESGIKYYSYSLDGGNQYSPLFEWTGNDNVNVVIEHLSTDNPKIVVMVYNQYDLTTCSNQFNPAEKDNTDKTDSEKNTNKTDSNGKNKENPLVSDKILALMMIGFGVMLSIVLIRIKKKL